MLRGGGEGPVAVCVSSSLRDWVFDGITCMFAVGAFFISQAISTFRGEFRVLEWNTGLGVLLLSGCGVTVLQRSCAVGSGPNATMSPA